MRTAPQPSAYAGKFTVSYSHRTIEALVYLPHEAPVAFADAITAVAAGG